MTHLEHIEQSGGDPAAARGAFRDDLNANLADPGFSAACRQAPARLAASRQETATAMSESALDKAIRRIVKDLPQLMMYHTHDSRHSASGWPDLVIARAHVKGHPGGAVMFRELKRERGKVTSAQEAWLEALAFAGLDASVWRPSCLLSGRIARELAALAGLPVAGGAA